MTPPHRREGLSVLPPLQQVSYVNRCWQGGDEGRRQGGESYSGGGRPCTEADRILCEGRGNRP